MHTLTKVLVILNLVICLIVSQYVWVSLAGNVRWRESYEWEVAQRHMDKNELERAYNTLLAARDENRQRAAQNSSELAALNATVQALEAWRIEAELAKTDAENKAKELLEAIAPFRTISDDYNRDVVVKLQSNVESLTQRKDRVFAERGEQLQNVANEHDRYAGMHEEYRRVEFQQFLMQEEYERRLDSKARYRRLRPDIQAELGDNGPVIFAGVDWVVGNSLQLNRGRRHGVELYQKYTIQRSGVTIAVCDVVEVQNESCECIIVDLVSAGNAPKKGDEAITRLFMSRVAGRTRD
ncbi:MAG: hypothetical protein IT463_06220 [Planctomycetes bacterium]|nr:hypothetical protein [Planctomycetota bacterium]